MADLHITNGDGAANIIKQSTISGDVLPWRDPMHHGPFPDGLDHEELSRIRARYLAGDGIDTAEAERDFQLRDNHLKAAADYDSVTLWFEHDLLDQLQILQLLDWFSSANIEQNRLFIICINEFAGIDPFRGIGQLNTKQMATLWDLRRPISESSISLAKSVWSAFRSNEPNDLLDLIQGEFSDLPFLKSALWRHFEEYPSSRSGLTRTESQLLKLVADGMVNPVELFLNNMDLETSLFIGDWRTFSTINRLCKTSLLKCQAGTFWYPPASAEERSDFAKQRLVLSNQGELVSSGEETAFELIQRDEWLGGVHLRSDQAMWTWNVETRRLALRKK